MGTDYDANTHQVFDTMKGIWVDEFENLTKKDLAHRVFYGGLWPVYTVRVMAPMRFDSILNPDRGSHKYFLGKRKMIAYLTKIKFKYPEASFEKY